jgi:hypothetical protein
MSGEDLIEKAAPVISPPRSGKETKGTRPTKLSTVIEEPPVYGKFAKNLARYFTR